MAATPRKRRTQRGHEGAQRVTGSDVRRGSGSGGLADWPFGGSWGPAAGRPPGGDGGSPFDPFERPEGVSGGAESAISFFVQIRRSHSAVIGAEVLDARCVAGYARIGGVAAEAGGAAAFQYDLRMSVSPRENLMILRMMARVTIIPYRQVGSTFVAALARGNTELRYGFGMCRSSPGGPVGDFRSVAGSTEGLLRVARLA